MYAQVRLAIEVDRMTIRQGPRDFGLARTIIQEMRQFSLRLDLGEGRQYNVRLLAPVASKKARS